jgi:hypothetical protein
VAWLWTRIVSVTGGAVTDAASPLVSDTSSPHDSQTKPNSRTPATVAAVRRNGQTVPADDLSAEL